jgi:hypothetical protein
VRRAAKVLACKVRRARPGLVPRAAKALRAAKASPVPGRRALPGRKVHTGPAAAPRARRERPEHKEPPVRKVLKAPPERRATKVTKALLGL